LQNGCKNRRTLLLEQRRCRQASKIRCRCSNVKPREDHSILTLAHNYTAARIRSCQASCT
jgi:hypothetical protein